ncbi:MAG TPA: NUDIX domain-containing protein [Phnomibacter sp.]|nr:NUDIX domain-containing protein [Phnomibacter sp.]
MTKYQHQTRLLAAVDCLVFGFDGQHLKILLIKRGFEPMKNQWSLMGGFIQQNESADEAASRILNNLTGLQGVYLEQLRCFADPNRDPIERTISICYFALIDINRYEKQLTDEFHSEWFPLNEMPSLVFDHNDMVELARQNLRYKATLHPILFELLPTKFTLPQLLMLFEDLYGTSLDKRNFSRKILSTGLLLKQKDKNKEGSKKGAFYYKLDKKHYQKNFHKFSYLMPNPNNLL